MSLVLLGQCPNALVSRARRLNLQLCTKNLTRTPLSLSNVRLGSGLAPSCERSKWSSACCWLSIIVDGRPDREGEKNQKNKLFSLSLGGHPAAVMDGRKRAKDWLVLRANGLTCSHWTNYKQLICILLLDSD